MSTYAVGDIQGCLKPLKKLLKSAGFSPSRDTLWCVGDLINRGPKSLETLRFLYEMADAVEIVLGNHDLHFLAIKEGFARPRRSDSLEELLRAGDVDELAAWLRQQPLAHYGDVETEAGHEHFLMVHAGVAPRWDLQQTLALSAEVEHSLQSENYREYFQHMYGDTPIRWHDKLKGAERLRAITNYLTRIRFCDDIGSLRLDIKEGYCAAPEGYKPWFMYEKISPETSILFGHWAAIEGYTGKEHVYALDTGYVWGRELTMMRLEDKQTFSVPASSGS